MATLLGSQLSTFDLETVTANQSHSTNDFRLTLTTALPVTTSDVTAATTIYFTPYKGNKIALYSGSAWVMLSSAEVSLAVGTITSGLNYDVFAYSNSGTLTLEALAWTNDTTRATALVRQDGVWCKTGSLTRRYVGTFRTTSTTTTEDSAAKRFLFNADNRVRRHVKAVDTTDSWTYTTNTFRQANASTANQVAIVQGLSESTIDLMVFGAFYNDTTLVAAPVGIGVDSTSTNSADTFTGYNAAAASTGMTHARYNQIPAVGYHYYAWLEKSTASGTTTWYGDNGGAAQCGISGGFFA